MPTYEYVCRSCGTRIDAVQAFSDPPLSTCEACAGPLRRVYGSVGVVFKGSGFYKTDSRTSAPKAKTTDNGKSESADSASKTGDGSAKSTDGVKSSAKEPAAKP